MSKSNFVAFVIVPVLLACGFAAGWRLGREQGIKFGEAQTLSCVEHRLVAASTNGQNLWHRMMDKALPAAPGTEMVAGPFVRGASATNSPVDNVNIGTWWQDWVWAESRFTLDVTEQVGDAERDSRAETKALLPIYRFYRERFGWPEDGQSSADYYGRALPCGLTRMWGFQHEADGRRLLTVQAVSFVNKRGELLTPDRIHQNTFNFHTLTPPRNAVLDASADRTRSG